MAFVPGRPGDMIVLEKEGRALWFRGIGSPGAPVNGTSHGQWFQVPVATDSEEGLLGIAFHPRFSENRKFYVQYVVRKDGEDTSRVTEWQAAAGDVTLPPRETRLIISVKQPYPNHNGGNLVFGPDGYLYIGWGDGGWKNDPHGNGQNGRTLLGKMLRIDVDRAEGDKAYAIPADNPFVGNPKFLPEIWALGLRNPWRYSFDGTGRLWVADVGQDTYEEIDLVERGANLGWSVREGRHCFQDKKCSSEGLTDPVYEYGRTDGQSVTGGFLYEGSKIPDLRGKYVFGDFLSGRLWAFTPPQAGVWPTVFALGKWPVLISSIARDEQGELVLADFGEGKILGVVP
jgi:glucose/arabinose dehydrogenase